MKPLARALVAAALALAAPARADVSPELAVANSATLPDQGEYPQAAASGTTVLVVWRDLVRLGVYGARVTSDGNVLDVGGILLYRPPMPDTTNIPFPHVAGSANGWVVVWGTGLRRVALDGSLPDANPIDHLADDVASNGTDWIIVYADRASDLLGRSLWAAPISAGGLVGAPHEVTEAVGNRVIHGNPRIASDGTDYLIAYNDGLFIGDVPDVRGVRVDSTGARVGADIPICVRGQAQQFPVVAFDGTNYLVAWQDSRSASGFQIFGARVSPSGDVIDGDPNLPLSTIAGSSAPSLTFAQGEYFLTWHYLALPQSNLVVAGIRVGTDGIPFAGGPLALSDGSQGASNAAATSAGTRFLVAYATGSIQGRRVAIAGTLEEATPFLVSVNHNAMNEPGAAFDGTNYLVSWADRRTQPVGPEAVYAARLSQAGAMLDPEGIRLTAPTTLTERASTVASNGSGFLVAWLHNSDRIFAHRVGSDGTPTGDDIPIAGPQIGSYFSIVAAASDGSGYLLVYIVSPTGDILTAVTVSATGTVGTPAPIAGVNLITGRVVVGATFDGTNYVVSFSNNGEVLYSRVTPAGVVLDEGGQLAGNGYSARVASQGSDEASLVVWGSDGVGLFARRVQAGHVEGDPIPLSDSAGSPRPEVAFDGESYVVAWPTWPPQGTFEWARVSTQGAVVEGPVSVGPLPGTIEELAMTSGPPGTVLLAYRRNETGYGQTRARLISAGSGPVPDAGPPGEDGGPASDASSSPDAHGSGTNGGCQAAQGPTSIATLPWILGVLLAVRRRGRRIQGRSARE